MATGIIYSITPTEAQVEIADDIQRIYVVPVHERLTEERMPCLVIIFQSVVHGITRKYNVSHAVLAGAAFCISFSQSALIYENSPLVGDEVSLEQINEILTRRQHVFLWRVSKELSYIIARPKGFGRLLRWLGIIVPKRRKLIEELFHDIIDLIKVWG